MSKLKSSSFTTGLVVTQLQDDYCREYLHIPDILGGWPWPRRINPYYEEVGVESMIWLQSFWPRLSPELRYAFDKTRTALLAGVAYPDVSREALRVGADLMNVFFVIEGSTDLQPAVVVRGMTEAILDAMHNPEKARPADETVVGEIVRQFWVRALATATRESAQHFLASFSDYLLSNIHQAEDRDDETTRTIDSYFQTRRENVGLRPACFPGELHLSIPDEAFHHPFIQTLEHLAADIIIVNNDLVSYPKELAAGDHRHNILTIVMHELSCDIGTAMGWAVQRHKESQQRFLAALEDVPTWGPEVDAQVQAYIAQLANWPRADECWSFESGRYFGKMGLEYQKTRLIPLHSYGV